VGCPLASKQSFTAKGTPSSGDRGAPACQRWVDWAAWLRTSAGWKDMNHFLHLSLASVVSRKEMMRSATSEGVTLPGRNGRRGCQSTIMAQGRGVRVALGYGVLCYNATPRCNITNRRENVQKCSSPPL
jgi:hypothetical protein